MKLFVGMSMLAIAINSLLVQTVWPAESPLRNIARLAIIVLTIIIVTLGHKKLPFPLLAVAAISLCLMVIQENPDQLTFAFVAIYSLVLCTLSPRHVLKYAAISSIAALVGLLLFLELGITSDSIHALRNRQTFGARSVPYVFNLVFGAVSLSILYAWKYYSPRLAWASMAVGLAVATFFHEATDIRGGYYALLLFCALLVATSLIRVGRLYAVTVGLIPFLGLASIAVLSSLATTTWNEVLSGRPRLISRYLDGLTLESFVLGSSVKAVDQTGIVDNSYLHLLVGGGLFIALGTCFLFLFAALRLEQEREFADLAFMAGVGAYFVVESILVRAENPFILYLWFILLYAIYPRAKEKTLNASTPGLQGSPA